MTEAEPVARGPSAAPFSRSASHPHDAGRDAQSPWRMPLGAWRQVLVRTWREAGEDSIGLVAAGVAYYAFLGLVPLIAACLLGYGLFADARTVAADLASLASMLPADIAGPLTAQVTLVTETSAGKKGVAAVLALLVALFGARNAAGGVISALNIAYEEEERRGLLRVNLLALAMTVASVAAMVLIGWLAAVASLLARPGSASEAWRIAANLLSAAIFMLLATAAAAALYRYGPSRDRAKWRWLTPGSLLFALAFALITTGFGFFAARFGNYDAQYGALAGAVVLLTWIYLSAYALLFGAELNSELEHQTAQDTTRGPDLPLGQRGAWAADHVAGADDPA